MRKDRVIWLGSGSNFNYGQHINCILQPKQAEQQCLFLLTMFVNAEYSAGWKTNIYMLSSSVLEKINSVGTLTLELAFPLGLNYICLVQLSFFSTTQLS